MTATAPSSRRKLQHAAAAVFSGAFIVVGVVMAFSRPAPEATSLEASAAIQRLQARLQLAQAQHQAYTGLEQAVTKAQTEYARKKARHDIQRHSLAKQELMLDNVMAWAKEMKAAQKTGHVGSFNIAVSKLNKGMAELKQSLAHAECPPTHGGQAALNMCEIKQQLERTEALKEGQTTVKSMVALRAALGDTEQTGHELDHSDRRLAQNLKSAQVQLKEHEAWSGAVLKENADFAALASTYLPGKESQELDQTWPVKPGAALSLLSNWMQKHDSWGLSSLAQIMKPQSPTHYDPTVDRR